jgi:hypothetical protein
VLSSVASVAGGDGQDAAGAGAGTTLMVAVPVSALSWPVRAGSGGDGRSALVVAGAEPITAGEPVVWCKIVVVAPAVVRRDGRVQASGRPGEHARLGAAEVELDRRCGPGTIERIAAQVRPTGKIKAVAPSGFATDGSYLAIMSGGGTTVTVRVIEYLVELDGQTTPESFCLITDLLDHHTHPAHQLAAGCERRRSCGQPGDDGRNPASPVDGRGEFNRPASAMGDRVTRVTADDTGTSVEPW